jgi:hypothetical protein
VRQDEFRAVCVCVFPSKHKLCHVSSTSINQAGKAFKHTPATPQVQQLY